MKTMPRSLLVVLFLSLCVVSVRSEAISNRAPEVVKSMIDAKIKYGLIGDGKADDTAGLQRAFQSGMPMYIPAGLYRFTETLPVAANTKIVGDGSAWGREWLRHGAVTILLYDGPEDDTSKGIVVLPNCHNIRIEGILVDGNCKLGTGMYLRAGRANMLLQDIVVTGTRRDAMFLTSTFVISVFRFTAFRNLGNGITVFQEDKRADIGTVNAVSFTDCDLLSNGEGFAYDGDKVFNSGYGFGLFGMHTSINLENCTFECNGGAGIYLEGYPVSFRATGCYFESNGEACSYRALAAVYGSRFNGQARHTWELYSPEERAKERSRLRKETPTGRKAAIIVNTSNARAVNFDNVYVNGGNGIWIAGNGAGWVRFRNMVYYAGVLWSATGNWEIYDSEIPDTIVGGDKIVNVPGFLNGYTWEDPEKSGPSGHPGFVIAGGRRRLVPALTNGLSLYVDTVAGDDRNDGRTSAKAWQTLAKPLQLLSNTTLNTPVRIHFSGSAEAAGDLANISGGGTLTLQLDKRSKIGAVSINGLSCKVMIEGPTNAAVARLAVSSSPNVTLKGCALAEEARAEGASLCLNNCALGAANNKAIITAGANARIAIVNCRGSAGYAESNGGNIFSTDE